MRTKHENENGENDRKPGSRLPSAAVPVLDNATREAELIEGARKGDLGCFEELYKRYKTKVFTLCWRMTGNHAEAEEVTQEAFLKVFRKLQQFRGESAFSTWLHRLTVNTVLNHLRKYGNGEISLDDAEAEAEAEAGVEFEARHRATRKSPREIGRRDALIEGSIDRIALETSLARLSPGYRIAFVLHDVEGYAHHEIAAALGCSQGTSRSQLHKARLKLRTLLHDYRDGEGGNTTLDRAPAA